MKHLYNCFSTLLLTLLLFFLPSTALADVDYFTITADVTNNANIPIKLVRTGQPNSIKLAYKIDDGDWTEETTIAWGNSTVTFANLAPGQSIMFKGSNSSLGYKDGNNFWQFDINSSSNSTTPTVSLSGNLMTLIDKTDATTTVPSTYCFYKLFHHCKISNISRLDMGANSLKASCYDQIFYQCTTLTTVMERLPATTLAASCYNSMFEGCSKITIAPILPATTMVNYCYNKMFYNCKALTVAPELPATTLASFCYSNMFYGCKALETAPDLPATTLEEACYFTMFGDCTSLTTAPSELPATTLVARCYKQMFKGCTALETAPVIKAASLPANNTSDVGCMEYMFQNCTALKNVKVHFTAWHTNSTANREGTYYWMDGTNANTTPTKIFYCPCDLVSPTAARGVSRIQTNWTIKCFYTYTFDVATNGGTWDGTDNAEITMDRVSDETLSELPVAQKTGYRFTGWNTAVDGSGLTITIANQSDFTSNNTFYAQFEKLPAYTFDVNTNGGIWDGSDYVNRVLYSELPDVTPLKTGHIFLGWYTTSEGEGSTITADNKSTYTSDQTFYARFRLPDYTFNVTTNGGTWDGTDDANRVLNGALPDATPQKTDYIFLGWYTTSEGEGSTITADNKSNYTSDQTFYARFQLQPEPGPQQDPQSEVIELDDTQDNTTLLENLNDVTGDVLLKGRTLVGGCVNTLCLPFSLTAEQLAVSPLKNCTIWEFSNFTFDGETLSVNVEPTTTLTAGVPYLVEPVSNISTLLFSDVTISASTAQMRGNSSIRFIGLFSPYTLTAGSQDQLFVGAGNKLLRPSTSSAIRGFRAWFHLNDGQSQAAPRARLTFGEKPQVPTAIDGTETNNTPRKIMINGQLYITSDGTTYTPAGNIMPK